MILTLGTSLALSRSMIFDRITVDGVNRAREVIVSAAGKSINAARVIHTLGESVTATGPIGGATGRELRDELDRAGVAYDFVEVSAPTRVCITAIDSAAHQSTELIEESAALGDKESDRVWAKICELLPAAKVVLMSGTLAPDVPPGFYAMVCRLAADAGVAAIVDAVGEPLKLTLPERPWLVKPNRAELAATLEEVIESDDQLRAAMLKLVELGAQNVAVTMGKDGAVWTDGRRFWRATSPPITPVSAIGSGDSFAGATAVANVRGLDPAEALRLAVACGTANALTPRAGFIDREQVAELAAKIRVEEEY